MTPIDLCEPSRHSGVAPRRRTPNSRKPWAEAHGYHPSVAPRLLRNGQTPSPASSGATPSPKHNPQRLPPAQRGQGCRSATTATSNFGRHGDAGVWTAGTCHRFGFTAGPGSDAGLRSGVRGRCVGESKAATCRSTPNLHSPADPDSPRLPAHPRIHTSAIRPQGSRVAGQTQFVGGGTRRGATPSPKHNPQRLPPAQRGRGCRSATTATHNFGGHAGKNPR